VTEYLRADRAMFVNTECCIQLDEGDVLAKGRHWYSDAVAVDLRESTVYLCEITYSTSMGPLAARLQAWDAHWPELSRAIQRDCCVQESWQIQPWLFIPENHCDALDEKLSVFLRADHLAGHMPYPKLTYLERVVPWTYPQHKRKPDTESES